VGLHHAKEKTMSKKPARIAYSVRESEGVWTRIGAAWPHSGVGFAIQLDALPLDGCVVLREQKPDDAE
jgi:hypothetical protein